MHNIGSSTPNLKYLSLHHAGHLNDEVLAYFGEKLTKLESMHIRGAFLVSRQAYIDFLVAVGPRLKSLTLSDTARTNAEVIESLVLYCPNIEHLNLSSLVRF